MRGGLAAEIVWWSLAAVVASQAVPLPFPSISLPTAHPAEYKRDIPIEDSSSLDPSTQTTATGSHPLPYIFPQSTSTTTPGPNLTLGSAIFTSAPAETVFIFSGDILAESHSVTLRFTSSTCTQNPVISITASITTLPEYGINSDGVTVGTDWVRCMVFGSGGRSSTYSAEGTGGWGEGQRGLVWTFTESLTFGDTTQNPWESGTALWINPVPTTLPRFVVGGRTVQFGEEGLEAAITTDGKGGGWVVSGTASVTVPGWPLITPGPVAGSDLGGAYPDVMAAGGAALIETGCCSVCGNVSQVVASATKTSGGVVIGGGVSWLLALSFCVLLQVVLFRI